MGMLTRVTTTCARVILMALTGDGSMSTNCCTELKVWYTHTQGEAAGHPHTHYLQTHTHAHRNTRRGLMGRKVGGEVLAKVEQDQEDTGKEQQILVQWNVSLQSENRRKSERSRDTAEHKNSFDARATGDLQRNPTGDCSTEQGLWGVRQCDSYGCIRIIQAIVIDYF